MTIYNKNKILIFAPHPDDETLGCGGTILKNLKKKNKIGLVLFTKISEKKFSKKAVYKRNVEINKMLKKYKFHFFKNFEFENSELDKVSDLKLISEIKLVLDKFKPNILYIPFIGDVHSDHSKISRCSLSCIKSFRHSYLNEAYFYETLSETNFNFLKNFNANTFEDISNFLMQKIQIMKIYKTEIKNHPFPRSIESIKSLAILRGSQANFKYAEGFQLILKKK